MNNDTTPLSPSSCCEPLIAVSICPAYVNTKPASYDDSIFRRDLIIGALPFLVALGLIGVVANAIVILLSQWIPRPLNHNVRLCLSLAAMDCLACCANVNLFIGTYTRAARQSDDAIANSISARGNNSSPFVCITLGMRGDCTEVAIESLRLAFMLSCVCHVLLIGCVHFMACAAPMWSMRVIKSSHIIKSIIALWTFPFLLISLYVASKTVCLNEIKCNLYSAYLDPEFRLTIALLFIVPVLATMALYCALITHMRRRHKNMEFLRRSVHTSIPRMSLAAALTKTALIASPKTSLKLPTDEHSDSDTNNSSGLTTHLTTPIHHKQHRPSMVDTIRRKQLAFAKTVRNRLTTPTHLSQDTRLACTILMLVSTYALCWLPNLVQFYLVCHYKIEHRTSIMLIILINFIVIGKLLLNAIIYAFRMHELRFAAWRLRAALFPKAYGNCEIPSKYQHFVPRRPVTFVHRQQTNSLISSPDQEHNPITVLHQQMASLRLSRLSEEPSAKTSTGSAAKEKGEQKENLVEKENKQVQKENLQVDKGDVKPSKSMDFIDS